MGSKAWWLYFLLGLVDVSRNIEFLACYKILRSHNFFMLIKLVILRRGNFGIFLFPLYYLAS